MAANRLIVTADDFGYDVERNRGIVECFLLGAVTRTSLLVNGVACNDACTLAKTYNIPMGLHLNLTEGLSVAPPESVSSLLSVDDHTFLGKMGLREAIGRQSVEEDHVRTEIKAQIDKFKSLTGRSSPDYIDGHQHVHVIPEICSVLVDVMCNYKIKETRLPADASVPLADWMTPQQMSFYSHVLSQCTNARICFENKNIAFPERFIGITTMGENMTIEKLQYEISNAFGIAKTGSVVSNQQCSTEKYTPADAAVMFEEKVNQKFTCELMVHPGYPCLNKQNGGCGTGADDFALSTDRTHELKLLCSEEIRQFYADFNIKLVCVCDRV